MSQICPFIVISIVITLVQAIIPHLDHCKSLLTSLSVFMPTFLQFVFHKADPVPP